MNDAMRKIAAALAAALVLGLVVGPAGWPGAAPARAGTGTAGSGGVGSPRAVSERPGVVLAGRPVTVSAAKADTVYLLGGPFRNDGKFQMDTWETWPDAEGWQSLDLTARTEARWHRDTFNAAALDPATQDNHAMWCGQLYEPCGGEPTNPGYGNNYDEYLEWWGIVPQPSAATTVRVTARLNHDTEAGYDFLHLEVERAGAMIQVHTWDGSNRGPGGEFVPLDVDLTFTVLPGDYAGSGHDRVHLRWHFVSDGGWSDQDCYYPTDGAAQLDKIVVSFNGTPWSIDEFEPGVWSDWQVGFPPGVGSFGYPWIELQDMDECHYNPTARFAFVDDGRVVPGTGGTACISWCYGPNGYTVNALGGLAGPDFYLHSEIWSPPLAWPEGDYSGATLEFDVYRHEELGAPATWPGMFYVWHVQSTSDPAGQAGWSGWSDRNLVYYGGPDWIRHHEPVADLLVPGRRWVRIALGVQELGHVWGYTGIDATPAPYLDSVALKTFEFGGPALLTREIDLAQDSFPAIGMLDLGNPGANSVRFDMAQNIATPAEQRNQPGDSVVCDVAPVRAGSTLSGPPRLCYRLRRNPLFDPYRGPLPDLGCVAGDSVRTPAGTVVADRWCFDLPDTGFLFPGDVLHYYFEADDTSPAGPGSTRLPADTTGFSLFPDDPGWILPIYPEPFELRALPSVRELPSGAQPPILFWNDFGHRGNLSDWTRMLSELGFVRGQHYDLFTTMEPSSAVGNGLGGRAMIGHLGGYTTLLYTSGDLSAYTITPLDYENDAGDDVGLVDAWLRLGDRKALLTGDGLVTDMVSHSGTIGFVATWLQTSLVSPNLRPLIGSQAVPLVRSTAGNTVFPPASWRVGGGCPILNAFSAIIPEGSAQPLAEFLAADGVSPYPYAAATRTVNAGYGADVILLPYDLASVMRPNGGLVPAGNPAGRTDVMRWILLSLGHLPVYEPVGVPPSTRLALRADPNPFNPAVRIAYEMPQAGRLVVRIHDLRGRLVRTLVDAEVPAGGGSVRWDGRDASGRAAAAGVYFCRASAPGEIAVRKLSLIK